MATLPAEEFFNLRVHATIPEGRCVYVQSGDPSDFDGYFIATGGAALAQQTSHLHFVLVIPERRACADRSEEDANKHVPAFSEQVLSTAGRLFRRLCPASLIVRGPLNTRNIIPLKFMFSEPEKYGPLLDRHKLDPIRWRSIPDLAAMINDEAVTSVMLDMNGSIGYLDKLMALCPRLGHKVKAANVPITIMAGILAEAETTTLRVPGRDPRATMNAIYSAQAVHSLLGLASQHMVPVLFVTNNTCNQLLRFQDAEEMVEEFHLSGLLRDLALVWYGPHLKGKCVPFDWVSFVAMVLHGRYPALAKVERRQLWVGGNDPSVLVLRDPALDNTVVVAANMLGTELWGEVECITSVDREAMLHLARYVASQSPATDSSFHSSNDAAGIDAGGAEPGGLHVPSAAAGKSMRRSIGSDDASANVPAGATAQAGDSTAPPLAPPLTATTMPEHSAHGEVLLTTAASDNSNDDAMTAVSRATAVATAYRSQNDEMHIMASSGDVGDDTTAATDGKDPLNGVHYSTEGEVAAAPAGTQDDTPHTMDATLISTDVRGILAATDGDLETEGSPVCEAMEAVKPLQEENAMDEEGAEQAALGDITAEDQPYMLNPPAEEAE